MIGGPVVDGLLTLESLLVKMKHREIRNAYNPVEAAVPTGAVPGTPGLLGDGDDPGTTGPWEEGTGKIDLVDASGTGTVEKDLPGTTEPVGAIVTVK